MFEWLKDKVAAGKQEISNARAAGELNTQFAPIGKLPGAPGRIVDRLVRYVLTGQGEGVVGELAALQDTCQALENAELYLRLALLYEAALQAGSGARFYGEERLLQLLQANRNLAPAQLLEKVLAGVQQFSPGEQGDDLTLIVGRAR
jgi:Stage II sporulation protein E (SpoIIE)